jgi:hypothetical protein
MRNHFQWSGILPGSLKICCAPPVIFPGPAGIHSSLLEICRESHGIYPAPLEIYWGSPGIHTALLEIYWESHGIHSAPLEIYWVPPGIHPAPVLNDFLPMISDFKPEGNEINQKFLRGVQGGGFYKKSPPGRRRQKDFSLEVNQFKHKNKKNKNDPQITHINRNKKNSCKFMLHCNSWAKKL